jgi:hypothetical protein
MLSRKTIQSKKALLIGVNYVGTSSALHGCWNDVYLMKDYLSQNGYTSFTMMTDEDKNRNNNLFPTRNNVLQQISNFVRTARPNEKLVLYFSGHGGNRRDTNRDERDGVDETICVFSENKRTTISILDDELRLLLEPLRSDASLRCFFDSCHSGTVLDLPYRWFIDRTAFVESRYMNKNILMISGCADNQYSHETVIERDGNFKPQGALTYFMLQTLNEYKNKNIRWIDLVGLTQDKLRMNGYQQIPQSGFCNVSTLLSKCDL